LTPVFFVVSQVGDQSELKSIVFQMLVLVPIVCGIVQLIAWSQFGLHGQKLQDMRNVLRKEAETYSRNT